MGVTWDCFKHKNFEILGDCFACVEDKRVHSECQAERKGFTDEDLKQLKLWWEKKAPGSSCDCSTYADSMALLDRLSAAEDLVLNHTITPIGYDDKYKTWLRSKGESE
jgi:hypothetical protein